MNSEQHVLYRFFASDGALLYVGRTRDPGSRWAKHADTKPWWCEVARITLESFATSEAVCAAEVVAIASEKPRYNIQHNGNGSCPPTSSEKAAPAPFRVDDVVALGLNDGTCPVGYITAMDDEWVRLDLMSWITGEFGHRTVCVRRGEIRRVIVARLKSRDELTRREARYDRVFDTEPLGEFAMAWKATA